MDKNGFNIVLTEQANFMTEREVNGMLPLLAYTTTSYL